MKKKYETGSHHLIRKTFFNQTVGELDFDVPDGDIQIGRRAYNALCAGCHNLMKNQSMGPKLHNIFGKSAASQKGFRGYSFANRGLGFQWSKQRLYHLLESPEEVLGLLSNMTFNGMSDPYERACIIEYLHYMRIHTSDIVKPEWINQEKF